MRTFLQDKKDISQVLLILALISPLVVMIGYQPTFIDTGVHAFMLLEHGRAAASGYLYTHSCLFMTNWTRLWYGPLTYYLLAPFLLFWPSVLTLYAVSGILAVGGGLLLYRFCREFFGSKTACVSLWLYSTIVYLPNLMREPIEQVYLPFFYVLSLYSLFKLRFKRQWGYFVPLCIAIAFGLQNHVSTIPLVLLLAFVPWREFATHRRQLLVGLSIFLLLFLPYLVYLNEDRALIFSTALQGLSGVGEGGEESIVSAKRAYSLNELENLLMEPMERVLKMPRHYVHRADGPLITRTGIRVYWWLFLTLVPLALSVIIINFVSHQLLKKSLSFIDLRHYLLVLLLIASLLLVSLFPYHKNRHLMLPFLLSTILVGVCISSGGSLIRSRIYSWTMWGVLAFAGFASLFAFLMTIHSDIRMGSVPTASGLPLGEERALSRYLAEQYPGLGGRQILMLDGTVDHTFSVHDLYAGLNWPPAPHAEQEWREMRGCGPRTEIPVLTTALSALIMRKSPQAHGTPAGDAPFLLLSATEPVIPREGTYRRFGNISIMEFNRQVSGTASMTVGDSPGLESRFLRHHEQYNLSLPRSRVDTSTFPPLAQVTPYLAYRYVFNATRSQRTLVFVNGLDTHTAMYYLDDEEIQASREYLQGGSFFLNVSRGEHEFTVSLEQDPAAYRGPTDPFDLYLFDFNDEPVGAASPAGPS